jgi:hypothetical protein
VRNAFSKSDDTPQEESVAAKKTPYHGSQDLSRRSELNGATTKRSLKKAKCRLKV